MSEIPLNDIATQHHPFVNNFTYTVNDEPEYENVDCKTIAKKCCHLTILMLILFVISIVSAIIVKRLM